MASNNRENPGGAEIGSRWERAVLHVDMDAFFVNVHILEYPEDRNIPLVVGGKPDQRGVVSSASYEAREFGIRSAMSTRVALRKCPTLKIVPANWDRIKDCSGQVMEILARFGDVEQISVDEAYLDLTGSVNPKLAAAKIRREVKGRTGLPCSVGLASSKLVAKVASDHEKPEGCTIVVPGEEAAFLAPLATRALWGIGPRTAERLMELGIHTCGQLAAADVAELRVRFGRHAEDLIRRARGIDRRQIHSERGLAKSISQEWTFSQDVADPELLQERLSKMSARVAKALQKRDLIAYTVRVKFRWADFTTFTRQKTLEVGTDQEDVIYQTAMLLWQENWPSGRRVRLLGVGVSKIEEPEGRQLEFEF